MSGTMSGPNPLRRLIQKLPPDTQRLLSRTKRKILHQPALPAPSSAQALPADTALRNLQALQKQQFETQQLVYSQQHTRYLNACETPIPTRKVSVIVPNFNYAHFLDQRIDSILSQTYPIHELILLDDASTDDSVALLHKKAASINGIPVKLIVNEKNSGSVFSQWKKGVQCSTGDFFWIAEADDFSSPDFLATVIQPFSDDNVILSYAESSIVDENGTVTLANSREMFNLFHSTHWESSFIANGQQEISNFLSINNTILNVSSLVWRKSNLDYSKIFSNAQKFRLAGDWYCYLQTLLNGDLAYTPTPLNYYRMHKGTVRSGTAANQEYTEISALHLLVAKKLSLGPNILYAQRQRRAYLEHELPDDIARKRVAFISSPPFAGSGGHRTIIQNINALVAAGYDCDLYYDYYLDVLGCNETNARALTEQCCGPCGAEIFVGKQLRQHYDLVFATVWDSANDVANCDCAQKAYFIQDYEPWFYPMGDDRLAAEQTYRLNLKPITIGRWLEQLMETQYRTPAMHFDFCADLSIYHPLAGTERKHAVCAVYQPNKPRRCSKLLLATLQKLREMDPSVDILLYGSDTGDTAWQDIPGAKNLQILSVEELNKLYNSCAVGFSISSSNPSRIPFEMLAAGLPVVELDVENNRFDFPKDGMLLSPPNPTSLAEALYSLLSNPETARTKGEAGAKWMLEYPLQKGFDQFVGAVDHLTGGIKETLFVEFM